MSDAKYGGELHFGGHGDVPKSVAVCPECGSRLWAESDCWDSGTGAPSMDLRVNCVSDEENMEHRYWQSDWQEIIDAVSRWCGATDI